MECRGEGGKHIYKKGIKWDKNKRGMDSGDSRAVIIDREKEGEKSLGGFDGVNLVPHMFTFNYEITLFFHRIPTSCRMHLMSSY